MSKVPNEVRQAFTRVSSYICEEMPDADAITDCRTIGSALGFTDEELDNIGLQPETEGETEDESEE